MSIVWEKIGYNGKRIRLTEVQKRHISFFHPEVLVNQVVLLETLAMPDMVTKGGGPKTRLLYKHYVTPVSSKYLAVVIKELNQEGFIVTSYFTDGIRRAKILWKRTD